MEKELLLDGFVFSNEKEYKEALKEHSNIEYISNKLDMDDITVAKRAYERLIASGNVNTVVGVTYLSKLRERLVQDEKIENESIKNIPVKMGNESNNLKEAKRQYLNQKSNNMVLVEQLEKSNKTKTTLAIVIGCLVIVIIAMFIVTITSDTSTYTNAKNSVLDDYATWQEQLDKKERELNDRENEIDKREEKLNETKDKKNK